LIEMPARSNSALAALAAAALVLSGCGADAGLTPTPADPTSAAVTAVRGVVRSFAHALAAGDGASACALLDTQAQLQLNAEAAPSGGGSASQLAGCEQAVAQTAAQLASRSRKILDSVRVGQVVIDSGTATIDQSQLTSPYGSATPDPGASSPAPVALQLYGSRWLIDNLG
jgi:hypothetical protein